MAGDKNKIKQMEQIINRLDQWIQKNRPEYYKILKPGLSDNEIKEWEIKFGFEFPQDFKALYQWKNGQPDACREYFYDYCFFDPIETMFWFSGLWERNFNEINED